MQNAEDRRQLMNRYGDEEGRPLVAVLKCVAGILILMVVAAGPWLLLSPGPGKPATDAPASSAVKTFSDSMAESRRVFEERRQRYEARSRNATPPQDGLVAGAKAAENPSAK